MPGLANTWALSFLNAKGRQSAPISNPTSLDPNDKTSSVTLSNSNRTATKSASASVAMVVAKHGKTTGKWRFQVTIDALLPPEMSIGVVGMYGNRESYLGLDANSIGYVSNGHVVYTNVTVASLASYAAGDVIDVYVDVDAKQIRYAKNGGSLSSAISFGSAAPAMIPAVYLYAANSAVTCNFAGPFTYTGDTSYAAWSDALSADRDTFRSARIYIRSLGYYGHSFAEFSLSATSGGSNVLSGGAATAQNTYGTDTPSKGIDGNTSTKWSGQNGGGQNQGPLWFDVDLGSNGSHGVRYLSIRGSAGGAGNELQGPTLFDLYLSADGTKYDKAAYGMTFSAYAGTTPGELKEQAVNAL
ncbi:hypothetical protein MRBLMC3_000836 [Sphingobium sp. LMC3-1-1.1]|uniref:SPRY domain-containing protein n=1 Tax=Sphingobium sp. LMC3-1-1.1 TaxID=3135241 RepID=UPI00344176AF